MAAAFVFGTGVGLATGHAQGAAAAWLAVALFALVSRFVNPVRQLQGVALLLLALASGWLGASIAMDRRSAEVAQLEHGATLRTVSVYGIVDGDVAIIGLKSGSRACRFALRDATVCDDTGAHPLQTLPLQVTWYGVSGQYGAQGSLPATGERWSLNGKLMVNNGAFRKAHATLRTHAQGARRLEVASLRNWRTLTDRARQSLAARLTRGIHDWGAMPGLVQAIFLGVRHDVPPELLQIFRDSGIVYAFAIAGLHVAIVAAFVVGLLSFLGVPRPVWCLALAPILFFYTAATGMSASALRACLMAVLYFGAPLLGRQPDKLSTLAAAAVIALGVDPFQLQDVGFCLSFAVMGGLLLLYPSLAQLFKRALRVDDAALEARAANELGGELPESDKRWLRWRIWILRHAAETLAVALTAWLSSSPLTAYYFGRLTPGSLLASLPVAPLLFGVGMASCCGLIAGIVSPWGEAVFNHAAGALAQVMAWVAQATAALPGCSMTIAKPTEWDVAGWYAVLLMLSWALWRYTQEGDTGATWIKVPRGSA